MWCSSKEGIILNTLKKRKEKEEGGEMWERHNEDQAVFHHRRVLNCACRFLHYTVQVSSSKSQNTDKPDVLKLISHNKIFTSRLHCIQSLNIHSAGRRSE